MNPLKIERQLEILCTEPSIGGSILIPVSPGELVDRLCISYLKTQRFSDPSKVQQARIEYKLLSRLYEQLLDNPKDVVPLFHQLRSVNEKLWDLENDIRRAESRVGMASDIFALGRDISKTNDLRASLKREINAHFGVVLRDEKEYR